VTLLERALDVAHPERTVEAEIWEAIGRAYAGPLEDIDRAQRCYRRALECNPLRSSAREALADTTAFDPAAHRESRDAHVELLERNPARRSSWRSLERIAAHWRRDRVRETCAAVLQALGPATNANGAPAPLLVEVGEPEDPSVVAASELLRGLAESGGLPSTDADAPSLALSPALRREVDALAGAAFALSDAALRGLWSQPPDAAAGRDDLARRARRLLKRARTHFDAEMLRVLDPLVWREQVLAQAGARLLAAGQADLRELLLELLETWPASKHLELRASGDLAAAVQLCPPARALLLRISDAAVAGLGL
jgi:hypothetical protein